MVQSISVDEFLRLPDNISIIDIRNNQSYNNNHIPNAINVPYEKLIANPNKYLEKSKKYYIYCQKGITSKRITSILNQMGYNVVNISGGYEEWIIKK